MERMEHIRGKILEGEQTVLDPVDGYLACHDHKGRKTFYGYFEMPTEQLKVLNTRPATGWSSATAGRRTSIPRSCPATSRASRSPSSTSAAA